MLYTVSQCNKFTRQISSYFTGTQRNVVSINSITNIAMSRCGNKLRVLPTKFIRVIQKQV